MLKTSKYILIFFLGLVLFAGCKTSEIPAAYMLSPSQVKKEISGGWTKIVIMKSDTEPPRELSGELIAVHSDSIYILTEQKLEAVSLKRVDEAILHIYTNQAGAIGFITGLLYTPNIIAAIGKSTGAYLGIGIPWIITGALAAIREGYDDSNLMIYPSKNPLYLFKKFARFPMGLPPDIDRKRLHLLY